MEYLHPNKKTTHAKIQAENGKYKINAETKSHGNKLSTRTYAFHQHFHACCNHQRPHSVSFLKPSNKFFPTQPQVRILN